MEEITYRMTDDGIYKITKEGYEFASKNNFGCVANFITGEVMYCERDYAALKKEMEETHA
nr:MAG TPA: hypothetical protein [Caudoviricetes sp.]